MKGLCRPVGPSSAVLFGSLAKAISVPRAQIAVEATSRADLQDRGSCARQRLRERIVAAGVEDGDVYRSSRFISLSSDPETLIAFRSRSVGLFSTMSTGTR